MDKLYGFHDLQELEKSANDASSALNEARAKAVYYHEYKSENAPHFNHTIRLDGSETNMHCPMLSVEITDRDGEQGARLYLEADTIRGMVEYMKQWLVYVNCNEIKDEQDD